MQPAPDRGAAAPRALRHRRDRSVRLVVLHGAVDGGRRRAPVDCDRHDARNEHLRVEIDARHRYLHDRRRRTACVARARPAGRRRRRRRHLQLLAARRSIASSTRPTRCGSPRSNAARFARVCRSTPTTRGPRTRSAICVVRGTQRRDGRGDGQHHARAARRRTLPPRRARARQPSATTIASARTSRCRHRRRLRRRVRVRRRTPRAHRRRRRARTRAPDIPVATFVDTSDGERRTGARARRPARVRSGRRRPGARATLLRRSAFCRARSRRCGRTPPARPCSGRGRAAPGPPARRVRRAGSRRQLAAGRLLRRGRCVARPVRTGTRPGRETRERAASGAALRVEGAEVSAVLRRRAGSSCACFRTEADAGAGRPSTHEGAPARGWVDRSPGPPGRAVHGHGRAAPLGDLHPPTRLNPPNRREHAAHRGVLTPVRGLRRSWKTSTGSSKPGVGSGPRARSRSRAHVREPAVQPASASAVPGSADATRRAARFTVGP